MDADIAHLT